MEKEEQSSVEMRPETGDGPSAAGGGEGRLRARVLALRRSSFLRRLALLAGSVAIGQLFLFAITPLLTRLYGPEAFGRFAVVHAFVALVGNCGLLGYPNHLPLCRPGEVLPSLAGQLSIFVLLAAGFVGTVAVSGDILAAATGLPPAAVPLAAAAALLQLAILPTLYLLVRDNEFRRYGQLRLVRLVGQGVGQVTAGLVAGGVVGLVLGLIAGQLAALAMASRRLLRDLRQLRPAHLRDGLRYMRREWSYPALITPASLLTEAAQSLPPLLTAASFGPHPAGMLLLASRLFGMPIRLLAHTTSQVLLADLGAAGPAASRRLVRRVLQVSAAGGLAIAGLCAIPGDRVWMLLLGGEWEGFATIVRLLAVHYGLLFVFESVRSVFLRDAKLLLFLNSGVPVVAATVLFGVLPHHGLGFHTAVALFVVVSAVTTATMLGFLLSRRRERPAGPEI